MIEEDLGYCCQWFFFTHYKRTALIASRLGVSERAVRYAKAEALGRPPQCEGREACMNQKFTQAGDPRKLKPRP